MENCTTGITNPLGRVFPKQIFFLFALLMFSGPPNSFAATIDDCLLDALKNADEAVTVGELRAQCQQMQEEGSLKQDSAGNGNGPAEIILKTDRGRKPAFFPHHRHQEKYPCGTCHHDKDYPDMIMNFDANKTAYKCTSCHNKDLPNQELNGFQGIGHALCRECHRKNQDITSAKCTTCHRRNL